MARRRSNGWWWMAVLALGCEAGTGGRLTQVRLALEVERPARLVLDDGRTTVTLQEARLSFGPLYAYELPPPQGRRSPWRVLGQALWPTAHAHPGHDFFSGGRVMTEYLAPVVVDLLQPRHELGESSAIAGAARSLSLHLLRSPALANRALTLRGTLDDGTTVRPFSLEAALPGAFEEQRVDFVPVEWELDTDRELVVVARPQAWLRGARFEEPVVNPVPAGSQTALAVQLNLRRASAWAGR